MSNQYYTTSQAYYEGAHVIYLSFLKPRWPSVEFVTGRSRGISCLNDRNLVAICLWLIMSYLLSIVLYPLLLLVTAPLLVFALFTTVAASVTLLLRVMLVYADLAAALVKSQLLYHHPSTSTSPHDPAKSSRASGQSSRRQSSGSKSAESTGLGIYSAGTMHRDFEGVGGWRIPNTESEDILWTSMNARLELPAFINGPSGHHRRAMTSGGVSATVRTPMPFQQQGKISPMARPSDTMYQEDYFVNRHASRSTTALGITNSSQSLQ